MSSLISSVYKSRQTVLAFLANRGYETKDYQGAGMAETVAMVTADQLDMLVETGAGGTKVYVKYAIFKELKQNSIQDIIADLFETSQTLNKADTLFIVSKSDPNETMRAYLQHTWEHDKIFIIMVSISRLQYNCLEHKLVPHHRVLSLEEKQRVAAKYNINSDAEWPAISRFDPVCQALVIHPGVVCQITRPSKTAITAPYWRICE